MQCGVSNCSFGHKRLTTTTVFLTDILWPKDAQRCHVVYPVER